MFRDEIEIVLHQGLSKTLLSFVGGRGAGEHPSLPNLFTALMQGKQKLRILG